MDLGETLSAYLSLAYSTRNSIRNLYFSNDKRFENYEYIMADIFDHVFASIRYFDLEIYEMPSGKSNFVD